MPEQEKSTLPPELAPPDPEDGAVGPPAIDPADFEDFPAFRETFLLYFSDPWANATLRSLGELLFDFVLEYWQHWPDQPEGLLRASLRAAVGLPAGCCGGSAPRAGIPRGMGRPRHRP